MAIEIEDTKSGKCASCGEDATNIVRFGKIEFAACSRCMDAAAECFDEWLLDSDFEDGD